MHLLCYNIFPYIFYITQKTSHSYTNHFYIHAHLHLHRLFHILSGLRANSSWSTLFFTIYLSAGALPIVHITLLCQPWVRHAAMFGYVLFSCRGVRDALIARSGARRLQSFAFQALFRAFLFFLRWFKLGTGNPESLHLYVIMDVLALMGGLVNVWRVPERFSPGTFDYWLNSHQIMHIAVILAILYLHWGTMEDLAWLKGYECPQK